MKNLENSEKISKYYSQGGEAERLFVAPDGIIERLRTQSIISRYAPKPPAVVYDIGGGAGVYSFPLAEQGQQPGELIQIDHMTTGIPGIGQVKTFNAVYPVTKHAAFKIYKEANSTNTADSLNHLQDTLPFPVISIQVNGRSEFMAEFEKACYAAKIPLFVLPPRKHKWNGGVERGNATIKYEFYAQYDGPPSLYHLQKRLQKFAHFYNSVRPHESIGLLTPRRFYEVISYKGSQSHMS